MAALTKLPRHLPFTADGLMGALDRGKKICYIFLQGSGIFSNGKGLPTSIPDSAGSEPSGSGSESGSLLFIKGLKKLQKGR